MTIHPPGYAMKPFNLAESKIVERSYCRDHMNRRLRVIVLLAIMMVSVAAVSYGCRMSVASRAVHLKSQLAEVQGRCVEVKRSISVVKAKSNQRAWQRQLADGSKRWLDTLDAVLRRVPSDVWLNRVASSSQNSVLSLEGRASSFESLSSFTGRLRRSPEFSEVRLSSTRVSEVNGAAMVDFDIQVKIKAPPAAAGDAQQSTQQADSHGQEPGAQESL